MSQPATIPDDVAARLRRLFEVIRSPGTISVYLFGSHAVHRAHRESDIDVGVLLDRVAFPSEAARFDERVRLSAYLGAELGAPLVDVLVLNDVPPSLASRIVTRGVRVYCSSPEADHAFRRDVQLRAADLEPFLKRMRRLKLAALAR
jgi:predicted nucleotidyltransferase